MESNIKLEHLFHHSRFPGGLALFFLPFYIPLGLTVTIVRFFFAIQLYIILLILPKTWLLRRILLRISGSLIGIFITQQDVDLCNRQKYKMIISNHITDLDELSIEALLPCIMSKERVNQLPGLLQYILKYDHVVAESDHSSCPLLVFPEGTNTSGMKGLLKFSSVPFASKNEPFLLALLSVSRPYFVQIAPSVLGSYWWSDLLWILFSPYTHFSIRFVQPPEREESQSDVEYSVIVQQFMAEKLGLTATKFDAKEKAEYAKRFHHVRVGTAAAAVRREAAQQSNVPHHAAADGGGEVMSMAIKVKDVLPQVPLSVIQQDLKKTKCIDTTISNILEGKVPYTKESLQQPDSEVSSASLSKVSGKTFGKSTSERHLSFQERKAAFLEAARQKYIAKHNLQVT